MTKDEARLSVMGAISMALKDPMLQQGFEIICKNLSELEKENAELKEKNKALEQYGDLADKKVDEVKSKLTEAKEIIQNLIDDLEVIDGEQIRELDDVKEAEKILSAVYLRPASIV